MKTKQNIKSAQGSVLILCLLTTSALGLVLVGYLQLANAQALFTARSQSWNGAMPLAEAGVEEALTQLNFTQGQGLHQNSWAQQGTRYSKTRHLSADAYYEVSIDDVDPISITSVGYARAPLSTNFIKRTIVALTHRKNLIFAHALVGLKHIKADKGTLIDSFDSTDPNYSTDGEYDPSKRKDNASVGSTSDKKNAIKVEKTKVYGVANVAPKGNVEFKGNAALGNKSWVDDGYTGAEPGSVDNDFTYSFPEVQPPWTGGAFTPTGGKVDGVEYQYVLSDGNWQLGKVDLKKPMLVTEAAVLYLTGDFKAEADITFTTNATLKLYMGGKKFEIKDKKVSINGLGDPTRFQYYGLPTNKEVKIKKKGANIAAVLYAPSAKVMIEGESDWIGSIVGKCVHLKHDGALHFDESINKTGTEMDLYVIHSWKEM